MRTQKSKSCLENTRVYDMKLVCTLGLILLVKFYQLILGYLFLLPVELSAVLCTITYFYNLANTPIDEMHLSPTQFLL